MGDPNVYAHEPPLPPGTNPNRLRFTLPNVATHMTLGRANAGGSYDGFGVQSAGHVWVQAGEVVEPEVQTVSARAIESSTASFQAPSWVLLQSKKKSIYGVAKQNILLGTEEGAILLAGQAGVIIGAGFGVSPIPNTPAERADPQLPLEDQRPFSRLQEERPVFAALDAAVTVLGVAAAFGAFWCEYGNASLISLPKLLTTAQATFAMGHTVAGVLAGQADATYLPGLNSVEVRAEHTIKMQTPGHVKVSSGIDIALASIDVGMAGILTAGLWAGLSAKVWSACYTSIQAGNKTEIISQKATDVVSRRGPVTIAGTEIHVGGGLQQKNPKFLRKYFSKIQHTQKATETIFLHSETETVATSPHVRIHVGSYVVIVDQVAGVRIGIPTVPVLGLPTAINPALPNIHVTAQGVWAYSDPATVVEMTGGKISIRAAAEVSVEAPKVNVMGQSGVTVIDGAMVTVSAPITTVASGKIDLG